MKLSRQNIRFAAACGLILMADMASAQTSGTAGWVTAFTNLGTLAKVGVGMVLAMFVFGGVATLGYSVTLLLKKGGDRGDDIEWKRIGYSMIAGALMLALGWVAVQTVLTLGGNAGDIGNTGAVQIR